jgi:two-component sensor histidine kinase/DNA-binding NarL/FixJ family response regulator
MRVARNKSGGSVSDKAIRVLLVEDNPGDARLLREMLAEASAPRFALDHAERLSVALERIEEEPVDLVLLDLSLPDTRGFDTFLQAQMHLPQVPIIVLTGMDDEALAVKTVRQGAQDYLVKGRFDGQLLAHAIRYAIERKQTEGALRRYSARLNVLRAIDQAILAAESLEAIARVALNHLWSLIPCRHIAISIFDLERSEAMVVATHEGSEGTPCTTERVPLAAVEMGKRLKQGQIEVVDDASSMPEQPMVLGDGLRSRIRVPLVGQEGLVGVLGLGAEMPGAFTTEQIGIARELAHSLAIAIQQRQLQRQLQLHAERLQVALSEKELLLGEIHHRVKNNLQVICSLLSLQAKQVEDARAIELLADCHNRVKSMALVHEKLYQSADLTRANLVEYIRHLTTHLFRSYQVNPAAVKLTVDVQEAQMAIDRAVPCGLIINELVSNALQHGFPGGRQGQVYVGLRSEEDRFTLVVSDDGIGFAPGVDFRNAGSLGLHLVCMLVEQLEGTIELERRSLSDAREGSGTTFRITFAEPVDGQERD